jgi:DinB superfamily
MNNRLEKLYNKLEQQRAELLTIVQSYPTELLNKSLASGKWSILQILTHLYISEKLSIGYIKKKSLAVNELRNAGLWQSVLMIILKISQRIPLRYKAPKTVLQNTPESASLSDLFAQWNLLRIELKSMLTNLPDKHVNKLVYKHPVAGRLSFPQAVDFFSEHIIHHTPQIKRILKK